MRSYHYCLSCKDWKPLSQKPSLGRCTSGKVFPRGGTPLIEAAKLEVQVLVRNVFCCRFWMAREAQFGFRLPPVEETLTPQEIQTVLKKNNMKQTQLARFLGVSKQSVNDWLKGRRPVPRLVVVAILALGLLRKRIQKGWRYYKEVEDTRRANERDTSARAIPTHLGSD